MYIPCVDELAAAGSGSLDASVPVPCTAATVIILPFDLSPNTNSDGIV